MGSKLGDVLKTSSETNDLVEPNDLKGRWKNFKEKTYEYEIILLRNKKKYHLNGSNSKLTFICCIN